MPRVAYTTAVVRHELAESVLRRASAEPERAGQISRQVLARAYRADSGDFAMFSDFLDGWDRAHHVRTGHDEEQSLLAELGLVAHGEGLHRLPATSSEKCRTQLLELLPEVLAEAEGRLDGYAVRTLLIWLDAGIEFSRTTSLPMLLAYEVLGPSIGDGAFRGAEHGPL